MKKMMINLYYNFQGIYRKKLYYTKLRCLLRTHIKEQIVLRLQVLDFYCKEKGFCLKNGYKTLEQIMCNRQCKGHCYPEMFNKKQWEHFNYFCSNTVYRYSKKVKTQEQKDEVKKYIFVNITKHPDFIKAKSNSKPDRKIRNIIMKMLFIELNEKF